MNAVNSTSDLMQMIDTYWEKDILPTLKTYIEIPAKSPDFDPDWKKNGYLHKALHFVEKWIEDQKIPGLKKEVLETGDRTPLLFLDLPGDLDYQVLMYGHLDKQPEATGWDEGLGPWKAVQKGEKLYGRGGADDGYAVFTTVCTMKHLVQLKTKRPHIRVAIEFCEESGSTDLPFYFNEYAPKFGTPNLIVCLDSGAGNYNQFWSTTSLRGLINGTLKVEVLNEGVHSGDASGIVPSSFRVSRMILNRLENVETGEVLPKDFHVEIPNERLSQIKKSAQVLGDGVYNKFPFVGKMKPASNNTTELVLNRTWRPALSVTGAQGIPDAATAGNVLRPFTTLKLSLRLPPRLDAKKAAQELKNLLEKDPPYGARVTFKIGDAAAGWDAPATNQNLENLIQESSKAFYGKEALAMGEGGSIPFMGMLGEKYPKAQFIITGILGPNSNAHGPNEFVHVGYVKKLTACMTNILANADKIL